MQFDIVSIFPDFFTGPLDYGIVRRAREAHLVDVRVHDLRLYTHDRHRTVDDRPFGGGEGMVLKPEPLFEAVETLLGGEGQNKSTPDSRTAIVLLSASGKLFRQETARRFAHLERMILLCGRYEGVDERVAEHLATDEISIGDYVLSGGELAAALVMDAITRLIPGALGNEDSPINESFSSVDAAVDEAVIPANPQSDPQSLIGAPISTPNGSPGRSRLLLECPQYTRPADFRGWPVPEILLGGNHNEIRQWRAQKALEKTRRNRADLLAE